MHTEFVNVTPGMEDLDLSSLSSGMYEDTTPGSDRELKLKSKIKNQTQKAVGGLSQKGTLFGLGMSRTD